MADERMRLKRNLSFHDASDDDEDQHSDKKAKDDRDTRIAEATALFESSVNEAEHAHEYFMPDWNIDWLESDIPLVNYNYPRKVFIEATRRAMRETVTIPSWATNELLDSYVPVKSVQDIILDYTGRSISFAPIRLETHSLNEEYPVYHMIYPVITAKSDQKSSDWDPLQKVTVYRMTTPGNPYVATLTIAQFMVYAFSTFAQASFHKYPDRWDDAARLVDWAYSHAQSAEWVDSDRYFQHEKLGEWGVLNRETGAYDLSSVELSQLLSLLQMDIQLLQNHFDNVK